MPKHVPVPGPTAAPEPTALDLSQSPAAICRTYREAVGTSQRRFAAAIGLDPGLLSKVEAGQRALSRRTAILLAQAIAGGSNCTYDEVLGSLMPPSAAMG